MKFRTHFIFPQRQLISSLSILGWGSVFLLVFLGLSLVTAGVKYRNENPALEKQLEELHRVPLERSPEISGPSGTELSELRRHLEELDGLEAGRGRDIGSVLSKLEEKLPNGVRLVSFQQDQRSGEIQLVAESASAEELSRFLADLEGDPAFSRVNLSKQSQAQGGAGNWTQFSVDMMENFL